MKMCFTASLRRDRQLSGEDDDHTVDQIEEEDLMRAFVLQQKSPLRRAVLITEGTVPAFLLWRKESNSCCVYQNRHFADGSRFSTNGLPLLVLNSQILSRLELMLKRSDLERYDISAIWKSIFHLPSQRALMEL